MTGNARSSGYEQQADKWYIEPRRAIDSLLDVEDFPGIVLDPACGGGNIPRACRDRGIEAYAGDIVDRGYESTRVADFLDQGATSAGHVICNPPFDKAVEFTLHALSLVPGKVCILQRTSWLEGTRRYQRLFSKGHLMRMWTFSSRISMPPGDVDVPAKNGSVSFSWFVFSRSHRGAYSGGWVK